MISEQLRKKLEARFGKAIRYSQECEALSESIYEETSERLSADTTLTETFLRMGIDELSVSPTFVLKVRDAVRKVDLSK